MNPILFNWRFRAEQLDDSEKNFLLEACCVLHDYLQYPYMNFNFYNIYASVATHETLRMVFAVVSSHNQIIEGADVNNA